MKTIVKFNKPWSIYATGDVAGFDAERAETLVQGGVAELYKDGAKKEAGKVSTGATGKDGGTDTGKATEPAAGK